jgi:hypothetical protein
MKQPEETMKQPNLKMNQEVKHWVNSHPLKEWLLTLPVKQRERKYIESKHLEFKSKP